MNPDPVTLAVSKPPPAGAANKRGAARLAAVQALYQMDVGDAMLDDVLAQFRQYRLGQEIDGVRYRPADNDFFDHIVTGVVRHQRALDPRIHGALENDWPLSRLDATLRAILRAGAYELRDRHDVPARVVIAEYLDIARAFYTAPEPGLVNGILDRLGRAWRIREMGAP